MKDIDTIILEQIYMNLGDESDTVRGILESMLGIDDQDGVFDRIEKASDFSEMEEIGYNQVIRTKRDTYFIIPDYDYIEEEHINELHIEEERGKDNDIKIFDNGWAMVNGQLLKDDEEKEEFIWGTHSVYDITGVDLEAREVEELRENPPSVLYHATGEDQWEEIQRSGGLEVRSDSRGISNRGTGSGIFTHISLDSTEAGTYGEVVLAINIKKFIEDGNDIHLSYEEPITEMREYQLLASMLDYGGHQTFDVGSSDGIDEDTIIISNNIPLKYIKRIDNV